MTGLVLSLDQIAAWINSWFMVFARVGALFSMAPFLGSRLIPVRVRVLAAILIALAVYPAIAPVDAYDPLSLTGVLLLLQQVLIGLAMGFVLQLVFNAVTIAGEVIAMTMGLGFAQMVDPQNGIQVPVVSQLYVIAGTLLFLSFDGHAMLLSLISQSFISMPIDVWNFDRGFVWQILAWVSNMFLGAVTVAIPIITALLITNITMGVMTRSSPQLNIFAVGFPVTILIGFALILLVMPAFGPSFYELNMAAFEFMRSLIGVR